MLSIDWLKSKITSYYCYVLIKKKYIYVNEKYKTEDWYDAL